MVTATPEDAHLAYVHGCSGIILSNHGGRQLDSAPPPLETLLRIRQQHPELLSPSRSKEAENFSVLLDGGVRRGSDVVKALCCGAKGVGLGRPFLYGQSAYGEKGVERVVDSELFSACAPKDKGGRATRRGSGAVLTIASCVSFVQSWSRRFIRRCDYSVRNRSRISSPR